MTTVSKLRKLHEVWQITGLLFACNNWNYRLCGACWIMRAHESEVVWQTAIGIVCFVLVFYCCSVLFVKTVRKNKCSAKLLEQLTTEPYSEPEKSNSHSHTKDQFQYHRPVYAQVSQVFSLPSRFFGLKFYMHLHLSHITQPKHFTDLDLITVMIFGKE